MFLAQCSLTEPVIEACGINILLFSHLFSNIEYYWTFKRNLENVAQATDAVQDTKVKPYLQHVLCCSLLHINNVIKK